MSTVDRGDEANEISTLLVGVRKLARNAVGSPYPEMERVGAQARSPEVWRVGAVFMLSADAQAFVSPLAQAPTGSGEGPPAGIFGAR